MEFTNVLDARMALAENLNVLKFGGIAACMGHLPFDQSTKRVPKAQCKYSQIY